MRTPALKTLLTAAVFAALLVWMLSRAIPYPATIDSLVCATSVAEFRPGHLDGKPTFAFLGQIVRAVNEILGGDRADLMRLLGRWCALFSWATLIAVFVTARDLYGGSAARGWAAVALLLASPIYTFMAAIVEKYTVNLFFMVLAVLFWVRRRYLPWGLAWGAALGAHVTSVLLGAACLVSLRRDPERSGDGTAAARGAVAALVVALPLYGWVLWHTEGARAYLGHLHGTVFGDYAFLGALRPDRILASAAAQPFAAAGLLAVVAIGSVLLARRRRVAASAAARLGRARFHPGARRAGLALAVIAGTIVVIAHEANLIKILPQAGIGLVSAALVTLVTARGPRSAAGETGAASDPIPAAAGDSGRRPEVETLIIPWLAVSAVFFTLWDHFYGQFSIYLSPALALLAAGIGLPAAGGGVAARAAGNGPSRGRAVWPAVVILAAVIAGTWESRGAIERGTWRIVRENDETARRAAPLLPPGSLVIAAWDATNFAYHRPEAEVVRNVSGSQVAPEVWKGRRRHADLAAEVGRAMQDGREVFVTHRWINQPGDALIEGTRQEILRLYERKEVAPGVFRLSPPG